MLIVHVFILLKQDVDMLAVKEIVKAYKKAKLDELNYAVYLNDEFRITQDFLEEMHPFTYASRIKNETF